jgi:hypothetical protein
MSPLDLLTSGSSAARKRAGRRRRSARSARRYRLWHQRTYSQPRLEALEPRWLLSVMDWTFQGPQPITGGQVEGLESQDSPVVGALHTLLAHPTSADVLYAGAVNGGIWKTLNATTAEPDWQPLTDDQSSLSIGAMAFDSDDSTHNTIVAGFGRFSAFGLEGGLRDGLLRTVNGGDSWTEIDGGGTLDGKNISGVAVHDQVIVVSVNDTDADQVAAAGIYRSENGGTGFTQIAGGTTGLPNGICFDLVADPNHPERLFAPITQADTAGLPHGGENGIYRSENGGQTWQRVSNSAIEDLIVPAGTTGHSTSNIEIAVGEHGQVFAAVMNDGQLQGIFRAADGGAATVAWTQMETPETNEGPADEIGLHPRYKPGTQAHIHFSILADPTDANIVYVGGDRQPTRLEGGQTGDPWPNSLGAENYTGRLFRGDASLPDGSQWTALTHVGTDSNSAPHADSREMVFDAAGNIIEADDGGIYRRTDPRSSDGDWESILGDLAVTELHSVAWDAVSNIIVGGTQDVGAVEQDGIGEVAWRTITQGDGAIAVIDDTNADYSLRYTSAPKLGSLRVRRIDQDNDEVSNTHVELQVLDSGGSPSGHSLTETFDRTLPFYTPIALNAVDPSGC